MLQISNSGQAVDAVLSGESIHSASKRYGLNPGALSVLVRADHRYEAAVSSGRVNPGNPAVTKYTIEELLENEVFQRVLARKLTQARAAELLGVHAITMNRYVQKAREVSDHQGLTPIPANSLVPLIDRVSAGRGREAVDPFLSGGNTEAERYYTPVPHGKHTFALEVDGPSMQNPDGKPSFDEGDIIFVDPDKAINSGDLVVARLGLDQEVTFKQYKESDGQKYLWALNPTWTPRKMSLDEDTVIVGVVLPGKFVP